MSETWAIPHWIFGYLRFEIGIDTNAGTNKGETTLSLLIVYEMEGERKEKKRKGGKKETKKRDVANFRSSRGKLSRRGTFTQEST